MSNITKVMALLKKAEVLRGLRFFSSGNTSAPDGHLCFSSVDIVFHRQAELNPLIDELNAAICPILEDWSDKYSAAAKELL